MEEQDKEEAATRKIKEVKASVCSSFLAFAQ
jgi:hypothetical protein